MHHFKWSPGDYARRTVGLTPMQDLAYRRMLDRYYLDEAPLKGEAEDVAESIGLFNRDDPDEAALKAVKTILRRYFDWREERWHNRHADEVIDDYRKNLKSGSDGGKRSGETRRANALAKKAAAVDQTVLDAVGARPTEKRTPSKPVGQAPTKIEATTNQKPETNTPPIAAAMDPPPKKAPPPPAPPPKVQASPELLDALKAIGAIKPASSHLPTPKAEKPAKQAKTALGDPKPMGKDYPVPEWVDAEAWAAFVEHRLAMRSIPFTYAAAKTNVDAMSRHRDAGLDPNAALRKAVANSWRGVQEPTDRDKRAPTPGYKTAMEKKADAAFAFSKAIDDYGKRPEK